MGVKVIASGRSLAVELRIAGVPVRVGASFCLTATLLTAERGPELPGLAWAAILLAVVLAQECGHALALARLGYAPRIWLHYLGGETFVAVTKPVGLARLVGAYLAGPLAGFALAGAADFAHRFHPSAWLHALGWTSAAWAACNLLPIAPLSGGKILLALLTKPLGARAKPAAHLLSLACIAVLAVIAGAWWPSFTAFVLLLFAAISNVAVLRDGRLAKKDAALAGRLREGYAALNAAPIDSARAHTIATELDSAAHSPTMRAYARELRAWAYLIERKPQAAENVLFTLLAGTIDPFLEGNVYLALEDYGRAIPLLADAVERKPEDRIGATLARALLHERRLDEAEALGEREWAGPRIFDQLMAAHFFAARYDAALRDGERWWAREQHPRCAFNLACTLARLGRLDEGGAWINRAVDAGWRDLKMLDEDPDLEPLRKSHAFHQARARLTSLGRATTG